MAITQAQYADIVRQAVEKGGFPTFVKLAWPLVCADPLVWNWHIQEICEVLEQVAKDRYEGKTRKLALCVPPASSKSLLVSVLWQAWVWTWWPQSKWITCTFEQELASDLSQASLDLVKSDWYQSSWPLNLTKDAAKNWVNSKGGSRRAVGTGGTIIGKHAHFHVGDDLIKEQDSRVGTAASITAAMDKAKGFWFKTLITRKSGQAIARVLVGQRLHRDDPPGSAIEEKGYESIVFPMEYEKATADPRDHRSSQGELLCEPRCDRDGVRELEEELGPAGASAQLQQRPVPPGGQLITPAYLENRWERLPGRIQAYLQGSRREFPGLVCGIYGDCTFKGKAQNDYTVYQFWAALMKEYWLIDQVRGQWGFRQAKQQLLDFVKAHPRANFVKLEDAANAPAIVDDLVGEIAGLQLAPISGGCLARQQLVEGRCWEPGRVHLPAHAEFMHGPEGFLREHLLYDGLGTRHDDQVATSGLALLDLSGGSAPSYNQVWGKVLGQEARA